MVSAIPLPTLFASISKAALNSDVTDLITAEIYVQQSRHDPVLGCVTLKMSSMNQRRGAIPRTDSQP